MGVKTNTRKGLKVPGSRHKKYLDGSGKRAEIEYVRADHYAPLFEVITNLGISHW